MWRAHTFTFLTGHQLTATSPHLMIIWKDNVPFFVRADQVQFGDQMRVGDKISKVIKITDQMIKTKVAVETEDGTIEVNGVLASGLCDDNPDLTKMMMKFRPMITNYKNCHFGSEYDEKCMNTDSWMRAYLINNELST